LWIQVDQQYFFTFQGQAMCQGNGSGGFSDPAFLVCDCDNCRHGLFQALGGGTKLKKIADAGWVEPPIRPGTITDLVTNDLALSG
jgi:hypothetical protein